MMEPLPIVLSPLFFEKAWGGGSFAQTFGVAAGGQVGEVWLCADLDETSVSGAGGAAAHSPLAGRTTAPLTLRELLESHAVDLLGYQADAFPCLIKLLDAREPLSVQVHPSPSFAAQDRTARLKTESWYVLDADPGSLVYAGLRREMAPQDLGALARDGELVAQLSAIPVRAGMTITLPSGIVHALGAGVRVLEVQTPSDTTFRLYDWSAELNRAPRTLHIAEAQAAADPAAIPIIADNGDLLASTPAYRISKPQRERGPLRDVAWYGSDDQPGCVIVVPLQTGCALAIDNRRFEPPSHQATVVPAAHVDRFTLELSRGASCVAIALPPFPPAA